MYYVLTDCPLNRGKITVRNPSGNYFANSISGSYDNNYELVDFIAPDTGVYTLEVYKSYLTSPSDPGNTVGIALVTTRYSVYLPAIMN